MEEARAHKDGIDFIVPKKNLVISVKREVDGEIVIYRHSRKTENSNPIKTLQMSILIMFFALILSAILNFIASYQVRTLLILAVLWGSLFAYYFYKSKRKQDYSLYRYHAAEHKALNYYDRYSELPRDITFLMNTPSYSVRCGSTIITVAACIITLFTLSIVFIPITWLKIFGCILSLVIVFLMWAFDLLNFFQKFVIIEPTMSEVEVAYAGMKEFIAEMKGSTKDEKAGTL